MRHIKEETFLLEWESVGVALLGILRMADKALVGLAEALPLAAVAVAAVGLRLRPMAILLLGTSQILLEAAAEAVE